MKDIHVNITLISILIFHLGTITIGYKMQKTTLIISCLNAVVALGIFVFFAITTPNIMQHNFEIVEILVLCLEACVLIFAIYSIIGFHNRTYIKVISFIGFGIHLFATIGMLYFMMTFKMNKLF